MPIVGGLDIHQKQITFDYQPLAVLCAQVGMDTYSIAIRRWWTDRTDDLHTHLDRAFTDLRLAANALK